MRQGDGSDVLGPGDPRNKDIGILYVESTDNRQEILTTIKTQELQGRKQIAIVLPEQGKAFRQPVDFDGLKNMRRELKAQLIFVAPSGPGPAEFARQRRFPVYSSLDTFKTALLNEGIPAGSSRVKTNPGTAKSKRQGILGFGAQKSRAGAGKAQGQPTAMPPTPPTPRTQGEAPTTTPPAARSASPAVPPTPRIEDLDTVEIDPPGQGKSGSALPAAAAGMGMGLAAASALDDDDELAPPPVTPRQPQGGPVAPIAQGSVTPSGPAVGPARAEPPVKTPPENRPAPGIIAFPTATTPNTPKSSGKLAPQGPQKGRGSGKLARADRSTAKLAPQGPQDVPVQENPPDGKNGGAGKAAAVAAGAALGAAAVAGGAGARAVGNRPGVATANATTAVAGGPGSAGPALRPSGLTPLPPPYSRRARRTRGRRLLIWAGILIVLSILLIAGIVEARGGFSTLIPGGLTATVTITPKSQVVQNNYLISAMPTGTPDPNQRQVAARFLTP